MYGVTTEYMPPDGHTSQLSLSEAFVVPWCGFETAVSGSPPVLGPRRGPPTSAHNPAAPRFLTLSLAHPFVLHRIRFLHHRDHRESSIYYYSYCAVVLAVRSTVPGALSHTHRSGPLTPRPPPSSTVTTSSTPGINPRWENQREQADMANFDWLGRVGATKEAVAVLNDQPRLFLDLLLVLVGLGLQCLLLWYIHYATLKPEQKKKKKASGDNARGGAGRK